MTKESLQKKCDEVGLKVKILCVEKTTFNDYEVVYTFDLSYPGRISYKDRIVEPELDELVENEDDFIFIVNFRKKQIKE